MSTAVCVANEFTQTCAYCHQPFYGIHSCPQSQEYHDWMVAHLRRMGVTRGWVAGYNVEMNGKMVLRAIPDIGYSDWVWLCNQIGSIHKKVYSCVSNVRLCRTKQGSSDLPTSEYKEAQSRGCCGFFDRMLVNKKTGSVFHYGFNYGH
jgi:hypothetical protein